MKIPIACSLSEGDAGDRLSEWRAATSRATEREATTGGFRLRFASDPALAAALADLAAREVECCAFLTFALSVSADGLTLDVGAPDEARPMLVELFGAAS